MGYYSELAAARREAVTDCSYPSPEVQLKRRLKELKNRLEWLRVTGATRRVSYAACFLTDNDVRYILPENMNDIYTAERALSLAEADMRRQTGAHNETGACPAAVIAMPYVRKAASAE